MPEKNSQLRGLPSVSALLETSQLVALEMQFGQAIISNAVRKAIDGWRATLQDDGTAAKVPSVTELATEVADQLLLADRCTLRPVINATGILLHTGLGRAPLPAVAVEAANAAAQGYCNVELDLDSGQRTQRSANVADLLAQLTGAEASHVVNNNAGATALVLAALATNREVIVSHGELIEIGGGYRLPDVIETFGARLRPVGTTNKTRPSDYEKAIGEQTGALLVVHPSNYEISGFTQSPPLAEIAEIARRCKVPLVHDIGSGAMIDFAQFGCRAEPVAAGSVAAGADLVLFSGDKLLGGPQAGIIVGGQRWIDLIVKHPLNRALRVDKITLAALRATLQLYRQPDQALQLIPLLKFLQTPVEALAARADSLVDQLRPKLGEWEVATAADEAFVGGGSVPQQAITSRCITIAAKASNGTSNAGTSNVGVSNVGALARELRLGNPAVVARVQHEQVILGLHGIFPEQDQPLITAIVDATQRLGSPNSTD